MLLSTHVPDPPPPPTLDTLAADADAAYVREIGPYDLPLTAFALAGVKHETTSGTRLTLRLELGAWFVGE